MSAPRDRTPYSGGAEGAPPLPPPGGYRGSRRVPLPPPVGPPRAGTAPDRVRPSVLGIVVLALNGVFALVLLVMWAAGATGAIYGAVTLAIQLALVIAVIAVLVSPRGRMLGAIALTLVLLVNVGTIGAASALSRPPTPVAVADPEADRWTAYPGVRDLTMEDILSRPSLEEVTRTGDAVLADIRAELTARFGYEWVRGVPGTLRHERNGYGGESMLVTYDSDNWATTQPITDHDRKLEVMAAIDDVLARYGWPTLYALNDPDNGFDPAYLERFYGSADVRTQAVWEWVSGDYPGPTRVYATLTDLSDDDGSFRARREGQVGSSGEPLEGLRISIYAEELLSEADVPEFLERMAEYQF